jgi:hypothetical protein
MKRLQRLTYIPLYHHHFIVFVFVFEFVSFHGQKEGKERKSKERRITFFFLRGGGLCSVAGHEILE